MVTSPSRFSSSSLIPVSLLSGPGGDPFRRETGDMALINEAERAALDNLLSLLESADNGAAFAADYAEQVAAARKRLRPGA